MTVSNETYNNGDFQRDLAKAIRGSRKGAVIAVFKKKSSNHGDLSDFGEKYPEEYKKLEEMMSVKP